MNYLIRGIQTFTQSGTFSVTCDFQDTTNSVSGKWSTRNANIVIVFGAGAVTITLPSSDVYTCSCRLKYY